MKTHGVDKEVKKYWIKTKRAIILSHKIVVLGTLHIVFGFTHRGY